MLSERINIECKMLFTLTVKYMKGVECKALLCHGIRFSAATTVPWNNNADFAQCTFYKNDGMQTC